ncbi:hypothetical protein FRB94_012114 [Tulasnella sp. JGI-2019a]|nr:hypothetical protein FRB94_012114 [Tulasnella sp. JGI-2019a]KAG9022204.1 hypothetical protein FRB95_000570 [Tulasnella sp. JGI-2019a]
MENTVTEPDHSLTSLARAEWLSFSGGPSENVLLFAQAVHRFAFAHSRQKDGVWIADYAYGCLSDQALDWFEDLDPNIRQDWSSLRPAMITKFRRNKLVPTAPAATGVPRMVAKDFVSRSRVRVIKGNGTVLGYVSSPTTQAHATVVASADEALVLDIPNVCNTQQRTHIRITARNGIAPGPYPFIGLENFSGKHWRFRACEEGPEGSVFKERARANTITVAGEASSRV